MNGFVNEMHTRMSEMKAFILVFRSWKAALRFPYTSLSENLCNWTKAGDT